MEGSISPFISNPIWRRFLEDSSSNFPQVIFNSPAMQELMQGANTGSLSPENMMLMALGGGGSPRRPRRRNRIDYIPDCDVSETDNALKIYCDLPGMHKENIHIHIDTQGRFLFVKGNTKHEEEWEEFQQGEREIASSSSGQKSSNSSSSETDKKKENLGEGDESGDLIFHHAERPCGKFERRFAVPDNADLENISASFSHGVLKIHIPKAPQNQARQTIPVVDLSSDSKISQV